MSCTRHSCKTFRCLMIFNNFRFCPTKVMYSRIVIVILVYLSVSGDFGRYQAFQFTLHILAALTAGMHMLSLVTVAAVPDHRYQLLLLFINSTTSFGGLPYYCKTRSQILGFVVGCQNRRPINNEDFSDCQ